MTVRNGRIGERHFVRAQTVRLDLLRQQVPLGDVDFVLLAVAGQLDDLHPVPQRRRDRIEHVRGGDEEHLAQVELHIEVVIAEGAVLLRVEHFQQRRRRIAAPVRTDLVHLIEDEDRVVRARAPDGLEDAPRHRADVGAPVAANLRLVPHAAERHAGELPPQRRGDALAERGLADTGRADEEQDRVAIGGLLAVHRAVLLQLAHREVFEDALLDLLQAVVIVVQLLARLGDVDRLLGGDVPGQARHPVEVRLDDAVLRRLRGQFCQAVELAIRLLARVLRHPGGFELLADACVISASCSFASPSSFWIAFICSRRKYSRWVLPTSSCTCSCNFLPSSRTSNSLEM